MKKIDLSLVKELREATGAGMMDCKAALEKGNGDKDQALAILRQKGVAAAEKRGQRVAADGLVHAHVSADQKIGALVEINCETDFVAKHTDFKKFVQEIAGLVMERNPAHTEALLTMSMTNGNTVAEEVIHLINRFGESIAIRRFVRFEAESCGLIHHYIHDDYLTEGKIGVLVELSVDREEVLSHPVYNQFWKDLVLQITAAKPEYVSREEISAEIMEKEKAIYQERAGQEGKPEEVIRKMTEGRLDHFFKEKCLLEQPFLKDQGQRMSAFLERVKEQAGIQNLAVVRFVRFERGGAS
ncbi:translation elongation factor Ts [Brevibacillus ruminantium]|uniref:Elongation factor Ts n=1 Tax=Brevibacillus ruminantium TaxID=2950604 RepID=A0ABY4WJU6_9BACL|nr:translation elongation factor Ts [Brevibacillus ruminantium]USG65614.1 translation elongation factor Ts [Brevibacillus ruminantium]